MTLAAALVAAGIGLAPARCAADDCDPRIMITVAGDGWVDDDGQGRYAGDGGPATRASLNWTPDIALGPDGSIYIADTHSQRIRKVDPQGVITTVAGDGWAVGEDPPRGRFRGDGGPAIEASLNLPQGVAVGADGSIYIADSGNNRIRKVDPTGIIATVAGDGQGRYAGDGGPGTNASINWPWHVTVGPDDSVYIADLNNHRIRRVDPAGIITTVAGDGWTEPRTGNGRFAGDGGPATEASLNRPRDVAVAPDGSLYIAELDNHRVRRVDPAGIITTVAGSGRQGYSGDGGPATEARLNEPSGLAIGADGSIYIADANSRRIRQVDSEGVISTVAGNGNPGYSGDGVPPTTTSVGWPFDVELGADGAIYIADLGNNMIRKVQPWPCEPAAAKALADERRAAAGDSPEAWREVAELYLTAQSWGDALDAAERLLALAPEERTAARFAAEVLIARVYFAKRDDHEARRRLIRVLARASDHVVLRDAADILVDLYLLRGERDQAMATLQDLRLRVRDRNLLTLWVNRRLAEIGGE